MSQTSNNTTEQTCLNCDYTIDENFCRHCGQKRFKRIDKKYVTDEIQYLLIHTNKGFLYTIKKLVKNPGKTAREFIDGNRVNHYKPLLLAFILSGISAFISFKVVGLNQVIQEFYDGQHMNSQFMNDVMTIYSSYNSIIMLALIPVFALMTWIVFMKWKNNYYEHIVMNAYILSFQTILSIVFFLPLIYILKNTAYFNIVLSLTSFATPVVLIWFFRGFYNHKPLKQIIWKVLAVIGLMMAAFFVLMIISAIGGVIYALIKGPEALEYIKPRG